MSTEILVAIITAVTGFLALVLTKEQKVSEFRQTWIDALREDAAQLMSLLISFKIENQENAFIKQDNYNKCLESHKDQILPLNDVDRFKPLIVLHSKRLMLRLNKQEHKKVIALLNNLPAILPEPRTELVQYKQFDDVLTEIESEFHQILKAAWERVKNGEPWFRLTKITLVTVILVVLTVNLTRLICQ